MSDTIKVYQKPTCSKCRQALARLNECGVEFEAVNYYQTPLDEQALRELIARLGIPPRELLRKNEAIYRELDLGHRDLPDDELIRLMIAHPDLMQRPIVVRGDRAVVARPLENLDELL
jgi:arsenate reductase (glutaredoxin)